jgi:cytochrome c biogenesis factor
MEPMIRALDALDGARQSLQRLDLPLTIALSAASALLLLACLLPPLRALRRPALALLAGILCAGEVALVGFHRAIYGAAVVLDPRTGQAVGRIAVPLWIESEKLYMWALALSLVGLLARRQRALLLPVVGAFVAALTVGALAQGRPFADPLPRFFEQYRGYARAMLSGDLHRAFGAFRGLEGARQGYYNAWYMWVHPPLLFAAYACFVASFAALARALPRRDEALEAIAGGWARLGYLPLTAGILLGVPWALIAWTDQSWWWSGKVNMSLMMWLLYSAWLHARLYLRRPGMWRLSAALGLASFAALGLTYAATYLVPGAHSVA